MSTPAVVPADRVEEDQVAVVAPAVVAPAVVAPAVEDVAAVADPVLAAVQVVAEADPALAVVQVVAEADPALAVVQVVASILLRAVPVALALAGTFVVAFPAPLGLDLGSSECGAIHLIRTRTTMPVIAKSTSAEVR